MRKRKVKIIGIKEIVWPGNDLDGLLVKPMGHSSGYFWVKALESRKFGDRHVKAGDVFCWFEENLR